MVRLPGYADRKPGELSGGQRQRVALARAIVNRPKVLLLDEPLGALDLKLREQMQVELKTIQGEVGITFVYVTHDQDEALTMSDRIAVFNEGRIEQVSPPVELYEQPGERVRRRLRRRLQRDRARRRALHDPPREDPAARRRARRPTACAPSAAGSPRSPTPGWSPATRSRSTPAESFSWSGRTWRARRRTRRPSRGRRSWWAGARSTRSPSGASRQQRRNHREEKDAHPARTAWLVVAGLLAFMLAARRLRLQRDDSTSGGGEELQKLGKGEGEVNLISWAGYVEPEWAKPFEQKTGCKVNNKVAGTSDEMVAADADRRNTTGSRPPATPPRGSSTAATSTRSTSTSSPTTRRSSPTSRTSPTTPSTASTTGSRTAAAPTC